MPPIFKALITISVWVLFIKGLLGVVLGCVIVAKASMAGETPPLVGAAISIVGVAALILACVGAWLRQKV